MQTERETVYTNPRVDESYCPSVLTDIMKTDELTWFDVRGNQCTPTISGVSGVSVVSLQV